MTKRPSRARETFLARAVRLFNEKMRRQFGRANDWRRSATKAVSDALSAANEWMLDHKVGLLVGIGIVLWLSLALWFIVDVSVGKVKGSAIQVGTGGVIGGAIIGLLGSAVAAVVAFLAILLLNWGFRLLAFVVLFVPLILWAPVYASWRALFVAGQCILLIPLFFLFIATRLVQLWRGIFYTCPARECAYRGLPAYVCSECGEVNEKLWPNVYGLLWHHCTRCDARLPTLDLLGRRGLERRCGAKSCRMPLLGRHGGRAPEKLVAIVGGPTSGKTCYLLMAVHQIINGYAQGRTKVRGEIDVASQEQAFDREWKGFARGQVAAKTAEIAQAFLLYCKVNGKRRQLYLYDAPGEEFASLSAMSHQQYFPLIEGFILLVDPESFEAVGGRQLSRQRMQLQDVVASTLGMTLSGMRPGPDGKFHKRVAVAISKADIEGVRKEIGDVRQGPISGETCRRAIMNWGGQNAMRAVEQRFKSVEYFACSQLGRESARRSPRPFDGSGVLAPLCWVLTGQKSV